MSLFIPLMNHKPSDPCDGRWRRRYLSQVKDLLQWGQGWSWEDVFMWCSNASGDEYLFWHLVHWKCLKFKKKWLFTLNFMPIRNTFIGNSFYFSFISINFFSYKWSLMLFFKIWIIYDHNLNLQNFHWYAWWLNMSIICIV